MRILVIEDEAGISSFLKQGLEEESYQVDVATTGTDGLRQARHEIYDLLLVDWMLPGLTGLEICRQLREQQCLTPLIFLTARDTVQEVVAGLQAGANDYIKKPFSFDELLERVRVQLRPLTQEPPVLTLGSIRLNIHTYQVFNGEKEVALTQKEFALLEYLIRRKGTVCHRTEIIEGVWDIHFEYNTGVIDVYINSLRNKLELEKNEDRIQTIRGVGYIAKEL